MKILHTADWHLGKYLMQESRLEEQRAVLAEICTIAQQENPDIILIAGDIYDQPNPPVAAIQLLHETLVKLADHSLVIVIAGNHDSPERIQSIEPLLEGLSVVVAGYPFSTPARYTMPRGIILSKSAPGFVEFMLPGIEYPVRILLAAYASPLRIAECAPEYNNPDDLAETLYENWQKIAGKYMDEQGFNLMICHAFMINNANTAKQSGLEEDEGERSVLVGGAGALLAHRIPKSIQYTALGHIHRPIQCNQQGTIRYSGSPLAYSMSEAGQKKQVIIAMADNPQQDFSVQQIPLQAGKSLYRLHCNGVEAALQELQRSEIQKGWVELTLQVQSYITVEERSMLMHAHPGILTLQLKHSTPQQNQMIRNLPDMSSSINQLFADFYQKVKNGVQPSDELMEILREVQQFQQNQAE